jgi:ankyrin repeat protein
MEIRSFIFTSALWLFSTTVFATTDDDINLMTAAGRGDLRIYSMMLAMGANPNATDKGQNTAVLMASYYEQREMVRRLIELHADVNVLGSLGFTPVGVAAMREDSEILKMLIEAGARLDVHDHAGGTPLLNAMRHQRDENFKLLLQAGANINIADGLGETPLMVAAQMGRLDYVEILLGKDVVTRSNKPDGSTALYFAIFEGHDEIAKKLIEAGENVHGLNNGYTLLHWAKAMGRKDIVPLLIQAGAV